MKKNKISKLESVLPNVCDLLGITNRANEFAIFAHLEQKMGEKYQSVAKPMAIIKKSGKNILVIAVTSSAVASEMMLCRDALLTEIHMIAGMFKIKIHDINCKVDTRFFDFGTKGHKNLQALQEQNQLPSFNLSLLKDITLDNNVIKQVTAVTSTLPDDIKEKLFQLIVTDLKIKQWQKEKGYPLCATCYEPLRTSGSTLCPICFAHRSTL